MTPDLGFLAQDVVFPFWFVLALFVYSSDRLARALGLLERVRGS